MKLKPCPFCGIDLERRERKTYGRKEIVYIHPENHCIFLKWKIETVEDEVMWNRRTNDDYPLDAATSSTDT